MDVLSEKNLFWVHSDLVKVIREASQVPNPFKIICGLRTLKAEQQAVADGNSTTMHSRHLPNKDGLSCAVDIAWVTPEGVISFAPGHELEIFGQIATQIKDSAKTLNIPVTWGGDWVTFKDWGHFELPWGVYP